MPAARFWPKQKEKTMRRQRLTLTLVAAAVSLLVASASRADMEAAKRWVDKDFQPSALTKEQQMKEMEWFFNAAKPFKGM
jgi:glycerol transport system substrate-binding protein